MASIGLFPDDGDDEGVSLSGKFLTFIVKAPDGCNLSCRFCIVKQRGEAASDPMSPDDLARFIDETASTAQIFALGVQGHEPLLPQSRWYTHAILESAIRVSRPATLVTNGVYLHDAAPWLAEMRLAKAGVSIDSPDAGIHDRFRGARGTWDAATTGVKHALKVFSGRTRLAVTSVLMPNDRGMLANMPSLLQTLGVEDWIVTPLLRAGHNQIGGPVCSPQKVFDHLLTLRDAADRVNIRLTVDDELDCLRYDSACERRPELRALRVRRIPPDVELYRLSPTGHCSAGHDILTETASAARRWRPGEIHASRFLRAVPYPGNSIAAASLAASKSDRVIRACA